MGKRDDNLINQILYGGKWETDDEGRSVPAGHAERKAAHDARKRQDAADAYAEYEAKHAR